MKYRKSYLISPVKDTKSQEWNEKGGSIEIFGKFQTVTLEGEKWTEQWILDQWLRQNNTFQVNIRQYLATPETRDSLISGDTNN